MYPENALTRNARTTSGLSCGTPSLKRLSKSSRWQPAQAVANFTGAINSRPDVGARGMSALVGVAAFELHGGPDGAAANRLHVDRVIQLDRAGIACATAEGSELRMAILKSANVRRKARSV